MRWTRRLPEPILPCQADIDEHELTHLPFRNWCVHCVSGRGQELPHVRRTGDHQLPEISMDYCFPGDRGDAQTLTVLVARERSSRMTFATLVPRKWAGDFIVTRFLAILREIGCAQQGILS